jgi:hypothetical protein
MMLPSHGLAVAQIYVYIELNKIFAFITHCCCCHVIDTYNQLPGAYQTVVVGSGYLSNRIFCTLWTVVVVFTTKKLPIRVMYLQEIYPGKLCQPIPRPPSSNSPKTEPDFIIHGKAIDRLAWRIPALL